MLTYISPEAQPNLRTFKYNGGSDSITYEYLWSPLAEKLVQLFPKYVAPNIITLSSLLLLSIVHLVFMYWGSNAGGISNWKLILMAVSIIIYQNLDNIDGKQARRTGSSSPLGMLFDHGTDAVASFFLSIQFLELMELTDNFLKIVVIFVFVMLIYFCAMWSQYSTGVFRLERINPVDEGLPGFAIIALICIFLPKGFWKREWALGSYNHTLLYGFLVLVVLIIYFMVKDVFKKAIRSKADVRRVLLLPFSYGVGLLLLRLGGADAYFEASLPLCYLLLFTWSRNMIEIQLYFVTKQYFNPFNLGTLTFLVSVIVYLILGGKANGFFWIATGVSGLVFFEFVISVLRQGSRIYGIYIFSLEKRVKQE